MEAAIEFVAAPGVVDAILERGGALYVWPSKARSCGQAITLETATERPDEVSRRVEAEGIDLYLTVGMGLPESLHLETGRRGRIRAWSPGTDASGILRAIKNSR